VQHGFAWTSGLCLCESAVDVRVNYLRYEQTDNKGVVTRWTWYHQFAALGAHRRARD
jgi:hypothetical protein